MPDHFSQRFMQTITLKTGDPTFSILKTHLLIEDLLRTFLEKKSANPAAMRNAKLSFAQSLQVAKAFCNEISQDDWIWKAMSDLNRLRNDLAHKLEPAELAAKTETYATFVVRSIGIPLPAPLTPEEHEILLANSPSTGPQDQVARHYKIDMANIGLYSNVLGGLGFDREYGLVNE